MGKKSFEGDCTLVRQRAPTGRVDVRAPRCKNRRHGSACTVPGLFFNLQIDSALEDFSFEAKPRYQAEWLERRRLGDFYAISFMVSVPLRDPVVTLLTGVRSVFVKYQPDR